MGGVHSENGTKQPVWGRCIVGYEDAELTVDEIVMHELEENIFDDSPEDAWAAYDLPPGVGVDDLALTYTAGVSTPRPGFGPAPSQDACASGLASEFFDPCYRRALPVDRDSGATVKRDPSPEARAFLDKIMANVNEAFDTGAKTYTPTRLRKQKLARPRHAFAFIAHQFGVPAIIVGGYLDRDHTSVVSGRERARELRRHNKAFRGALDAAWKKSLEQGLTYGDLGVRPF